VCTEALALARALGDKPVSAQALTALGVLARHHGDLTATRSLLEQSLALYRELGDKWGIAGVLDELALFGGRLAVQRARYEESLAIRREIGDWWGIAHSLHHLGDVARLAGDWTTARTRYEESLAIERQMGRRGGIAWALHRLGNVAHGQGDPETAQVHYEDALRLAREIGSRRIVDRCLEHLGGLAAARGDFAGARALLTESLLRRRETGDNFGLVWSLLSFAALASAQAKPERSLRLAAAAAALRDAIGATSLLHEDEAELDRLQRTARRQLMEEAHSAAWTQGRAMPLPRAIAYAMEDAAPTPAES
jgi:tetratricopeptide (TPR) repeat protein